jgi:hypothetical protein
VALPLWLAVDVRSPANACASKSSQRESVV